MALERYDRIAETTTTTGTGTYNLAGAKTGFKALVDRVTTGATVEYCVTDGTDWEVGIGTFTDATPDTLARTTVLASSNADAAVSWGAGSKDVFLTLPASRMVPGLTGEVMYSSAEGIIDGASALHWDNGNSRLGVNQSSPARTLDINGTTRHRDSAYFGAADANGLITWDSTYFKMIGRSGSPGVSLRSSGSTREAVAVHGTSGLVGINLPDGHTSQAAQLDVRTSGTGVIGQIIKGTAGQTSDYMQIQTSAGAVKASLGVTYFVFGRSSPIVSNSNYPLSASGISTNQMIIGASKGWIGHHGGWDNNGDGVSLISYASKTLKFYTNAKYDPAAQLIEIDTAGAMTIQSNAAAAGTLVLATGETTVVDGDILGRIDFQAPQESSGTDAILVGASIWAEADDAFAADNNATDLVFATGESETAVEKMRLTSDGKLGIGTATPSELFEVAGTSEFTDTMYFGSARANGKITWSGSNFQFNAAGSGGRISLGASGTNTHTMILDGVANNVGINIGNNTPGAQLHVQTSGTGVIGQIIKATAGQTANLQEWQDSAGVIDLSVNAAGVLQSLNNTPIIQNDATGAYPNQKLTLSYGTYNFVDNSNVLVMGISRSGNTLRSGVQLGSASSFNFTSTTPGGDGDTFIRRSSAGNITIDNATRTGVELGVGGIVVEGAAGSAGALTLSTAELTVVDGDILGRIDFQAPLESAGTDAILVGASIWAEADDTFAADNNRTDLVFATGASETAAEKMRLTSAGVLGIGGIPLTADTRPLQIFNSYTDNSNYESLIVGVSSNDWRILADAAGTGTARRLLIGTGDAQDVRIVIANAEKHYFKADGTVGINESTPAAQLHTQTSGTGVIGQIIKGTSGQTANLQEWQDSTGGVGVSVNDDGTELGVGDSGNTVPTLRAITHATGFGFESSGSIINIIHAGSRKGAFQSAGLNLKAENVGFDYPITWKTSVSSTTQFRIRGLTTGYGVLDGRIGTYLQPTGGNVGIGTTTPNALLNVQAVAGSAGALTLSTAELTVVDGDILGRIDFQAPLESSGTDAILVGASIWAEADDTFAADNNATDLVFATGASETATEKFRLTAGTTTTGEAIFGTENGVVSNVLIFGSLTIREKTDTYNRKIAEIPNSTSGGQLRLFASGSVQAVISGTPNVYSYINNNKGLSVGTATDALASKGARVLIDTNGTGNIGLVIEGTSGQTANLFEAQDSSGNVGATINAALEFTNSGGFASTLQIGSGTTVSATLQTVIGAGASGGGDGSSTVIGSNAGGSASFGGVCIGSAANILADHGIAIGAGAHTFNNVGAIVIGHSAKPSYGVGYGVCIGKSASFTAANQFVSGSSSYPINEVYFGKGVTNATPTNYTLHGTGGSGTDIAGGDITIAGGKGTGTGVGGDIVFQTATAGSTGSGLNSLATALTISSVTQNVLLQTSGTGIIGQRIKLTSGQTADAFDIVNSAGAELFSIDAAGTLRTKNNIFAIANGSISYSNQGILFAYGDFGFTDNTNNIQVAFPRDSRGILRTGIQLPSTSCLNFTSGTMNASNSDAFIGRFAAGVINIAASGVGSTDGELLADNISTSSNAEGSTARLTRRTTHETHTLSLAASSVTTTISIPSGSRLLAVQMNVNTAVTDDAGDGSWTAEFITGSTTSITWGAAAAQNTKVDVMLPDEITSGIAEITFQSSMGGSFTAGVIEIVCYYEQLTSMANA